jgi:membrane protein
LSTLKGSPSHLQRFLPRAWQGSYVFRLWSTVWHSIKYYAVGLWHYADDDHCFLLAAGIAFNVLYCLIPLTLVAFYIFSIALSNEEQASRTVLNYISQTLPLPYYREALVQWLSIKLVAVKHTGPIAGLVGGITLAWLASIVFSTLRTSLNAIYGFRTKSNYFKQKLLDIVLMVVVIVLLLGTTLLTPFISLFHQLGSSWLPDSISNFSDSVVPFFVSLGLSALLYIILFRMLPHERLSRNAVFVSAATAVILTELMKYAFSFYMQKLSSVGALYGSFAFIVGISLWIYYVSVVFTIAAEVGWLYRERHEMYHKWQDAEHPGAAAIDPTIERDYQKTKSNPTKAAGIQKPHANPEQGTPEKPLTNNAV